jgi:TolB-like protein
MELKSGPAHARLRLMGRFGMDCGGGFPIEITSRRARGVIAYLALVPEHGATSGRLAGLFWSDRSEVQARASLRQCLLELRTQLKAPGPDLFDIGRDYVALKGDAWSSDVGDIQAILGADDADGVASVLTSIGAARLLEDPEIGGLFGEWLEGARVRFDQSIAQAVLPRLQRLSGSEDWRGVLAIADAYLSRDPLDEAVAAAAIWAEGALGNTSAAHRRFQSLESALAKEFGVTPGHAAREALAATAPPPLGGPQKPGERQVIARPTKPSIAVLPFKNMSGDDQEYLADAITDDIVAALSRWRWFFVIATGSSYTYKDKDVEVGRIGDELGVRYILDGSVRRNGPRVRVTAQLIDTTNDATLWADRLDRFVVDTLALQDEITEQVVTAIAPTMLHSEGARVVRDSLTDFTALDCFYRGMWHLNKVSRNGYLEALTLFEEAIHIDPDLALGHIGLSRILYGGAIFGWSVEPAADLRRARSAAQTAIRLDARDSVAYYACSGASLYLGDHGASLNEARSAIDLNPNFALAQVRLGQALVFSGRPAEAIDPIERGVRLSPYDPQLAVTLEVLALAHYQARNYEQAVRHARAAMHQSSSSASVLLAASLAQLGRLEEAAKAMPRTRWRGGSTERPMTAPYADPAYPDHLRQGVRLAREAIRA